MSNTF